MRLYTMLSATCQACAFGCRPVEMTYDGDVLHVAPIALAAPLHFVLVDLRAAKDTVIILSRLQVQTLHGSPHPVVLARDTVRVLWRRQARGAGQGSCCQILRAARLIVLAAYLRKRGRHQAAFVLWPSSSPMRTLAGQHFKTPYAPRHL